MMEAVRVPPFERFYEANRDEIYAFLVRRLGRERAEDAFQETFLRALRAYGRLRHGRHLREPTAPDRRPAYAELEHLAGALPPTERTAVILRYGYDLDYAEIGAALGSSPEAARQATSAGVRRLRKELT
jgi:DNA-directed RNA polymerase specialized sigma24 family protein